MATERVVISSVSVWKTEAFVVKAKGIWGSLTAKESFYTDKSISQLPWCQLGSGIACY